MKAMVLNTYDEALKNDVWVSMQDVPDAKIASPDEVIVKIGGAGVCRTDLHIIEGIWKPLVDPSGDALLPMIMGHENAGWVEEVGSNVRGLRVGDPVILHPKITDPYDINVRRGHDMHAEGKFLGLDCDGGYAEYLTTNQRNIVALPKHLEPKAVAAFADAGLTAYHASKKASQQLLPGQFVVVIGAGGLGHIGIQVLKAMCGAEIIAIDNSDVALQLAKDCGADHLIKADGSEVDQVLELTSGGAQIVMDYVGEKGTTTKGLNMTRPMGSYFVVGYGEDVTYPTVNLVSSEKNIIGNLVGTWADLNELMSLAGRGLVKLTTKDYSLADANTALHDLAAGRVKGRAILIP
jgi:NAD+-dependent secondary alcohol dehydrogenase Adh1